MKDIYKVDERCSSYFIILCLFHEELLVCDKGESSRDDVAWGNVYGQVEGGQHRQGVR